MADPVTFTDVEKLSLNLETVDAAGNAGPAPATPVTWTADGGDVSLVVSDDTLSAEATANGALGSTTVTVSDANGLGDSIVLTVEGSAATGLRIVAGAPEPQ